jgi:hypothetical protein
MSDAGNTVGFLNVPLREQRRDCFLFLSAEFCSMSYHLTPSATICWLDLAPSPILRLC